MYSFNLKDNKKKYGRWGIIGIGTCQLRADYGGLDMLNIKMMQSGLSDE